MNPLLSEGKDRPGLARSLRVAVIGRTEMLLQAAKAVQARGHRIALVVTSRPSPESQAAQDDFRKLAEEAGAGYLEAVRLDPQATGFMAQYPCDIAISMNWPTMIREHVSDLFKLGIINSHGSDLPKYRGNACPNWAILAGEAEIGLTFHLIDPNGLDTGDIIAQRFIRNHDDLYIGGVYDWLRSEIPVGLADAVDALADPGFKPRPQRSEGAIRAYPRRVEDGKLVFSQPADMQHRLVRASSRPFAGAFCQYDDGRRVTVWRASIHRYQIATLAMPGQILHFEDGKPVVAFADAALRFDEFETENGAPLPRSVRARFH